MRCSLSVLGSDVLFPRNRVGRWSCEGLSPCRLVTRKYQSVAYAQSSGGRCYLQRADEARTLNSLSPQNFVHWCCRLYSSSPWWLCSSRCPPHWGVLAVSSTLTPDRSLSRSQPGSFRPSPVQETGRRWTSSVIYPASFNSTANFLKCAKTQDISWDGCR